MLCNAGGRLNSYTAARTVRTTWAGFRVPDVGILPQNEEFYRPALNPGDRMNPTLGMAYSCTKTINDMEHEPFWGRWPGRRDSSLDLKPQQGYSSPFLFTRLLDLDKDLNPKP